MSERPKQVRSTTWRSLKLARLPKLNSRAEQYAVHKKQQACSIGHRHPFHGVDMPSRNNHRPMD